MSRAHSNHQAGNGYYQNTQIDFQPQCGKYTSFLSPIFYVKSNGLPEKELKKLVKFLGFVICTF